MRAEMIKRVERADGVRFQVYGRRAGKKVYVGTYATKSAAEEAEEDHRVTSRKIERGELPATLESRRTLKQAADAWLTGLLKNGSRSETTYRAAMVYQVLPWLGSRQLIHLTKPQIAAWRDECALKFAATTVNGAIGCLSSALSSFVELGWIPSNPCKGVKFVKVKDRAYNWIRTVPEMERLLSECDIDIRDIVAMALGSGMRIDEILHLAWDDIDLERRLMTIQRGRKGTPKGGMRHVPILDSVLPVLRERQLKRAGAFLVFPTSRGRVRAKSTITVAYKASLVRAELDRKIRFHDLRHTFASHWVMNGGDIFRLSRVLGHKSVIVTQRTYAHLVPEAWTQDHGRVAFRLPAPATVLQFVRGPDGIAGRKRVPSRISPPSPLSASAPR